MSLIDRSFEEVCSIMDHTGDSVELLVEHATDFRMCDLLDENLPPGAGGFGGTPSGSPRKSGDGPVGLGLISGMFLKQILKKLLFEHENTKISEIKNQTNTLKYFELIVEFWNRTLQTKCMIFPDPENIVDKSPSSPTRRKLPKTPV